MSMYRLAPLTWHAADEEKLDEEDVEEEEPAHVISAFGRLPDGRSACLRLPWCPRFFVATSKLITGGQQIQFLEKFAKRDQASSRIVSAASIMGFCNQKRSPFIRLVFKSRSECNKARYKAQNEHRTYESSVDTISQFLHAAGIRPGGWLAIERCRLVVGEERFSTCDIELRVNAYTDVKPTEPPVLCVPWSMASWDLETYSPTGRFPDPSAPECPIIQIGVVFTRYRQHHSQARRVVITTTPCDTTPGVEVIEAGSEAGALKTFAALLAEHQVDILLAWNGFGFDNNYLFVRASILELEEHLNFSKLLHAGLSSVNRSIKGRDVVLLSLPGVLQYDPMMHLRADNRFERYSLNYVAGKVLGEQKVDLPYQEMFQLHREGTPAGQARIAEYCAKDCDLPLLIMDKMALLPGIMALASATRTIPELVLTRGQVCAYPVCQLFVAHGVKARIVLIQ